MDIHRCRFVPYNPKAINALAFSHLPSNQISGYGPPTLRLAVGRANGDLEIWNPLRGAWVQESIFRGGKDRSIEGLVWTLDPPERAGEEWHPGKLRLFSIGYSSAVTEWDLEQGRPIRHSTGNYSEIWCFAAQPRIHALKKGGASSAAETEHPAQCLAAGCADGSIVILSTDDDSLSYKRTIRPSTKRSRILSITFQNRNTVVAGYADSSIRVFDIRNGTLLRTISLGRGPSRSGGKAPKELLVWSVKCLPDGNIVSGDSAGEIRFWEGRNYSMFQRILGHQADVLDVAVSADGKTVISVGADQTTVLYKLRGHEKGNTRSRWAEVAHRRYHTHDVKTLAVYEAGSISVMVSGGLDTAPVVVPLREYGKENHRTLSSLPQTPQLSSSPSSRLVMSWWDREVNLWRVSRPNNGELLSLGGKCHRLVGKILFQGEEYLTAAALSRDGRVLVTATMSELKLFSLKWIKEAPRPTLNVRKIELSTNITEGGAKALAISPDNQWLTFIRPDNEIYIAQILYDEGHEPQISGSLANLRRVSRRAHTAKLHFGSLGRYDRCIRCISFSEDSKTVAVGDLSGYIDTWTLQGTKDAPIVINGASSPLSSEPEDSSSDDEGMHEGNVPRCFGGRRWVRASEVPLPRLSSGILMVSFRPLLHPPSETRVNGASHGAFQRAISPIPNQSSADDRLMAMTFDHQLVELHARSGKLSDWSRRNPKSLLPAAFTTLKDRATGLFWDVSNTAERLWIYGHDWMWMFDLSQDFPSPEDETEKLATSESLTSKNKRKREHGGEASDRDRKRTNTGAGDRMTQSDIALGSKIRKFTGNSEEDATWIEIANPLASNDPADAEDENNYPGEDDGAAAADTRLAQLRRQRYADGRSSFEDEEREVPGHESQNHEGDHVTLKGIDNIPHYVGSKFQVALAVVIDNGTGSKHTADADHSREAPRTVNGAEEQQRSRTEFKRRSQPGHRWWYTFKYRDIFGIVPLKEAVAAGDDKGEMERGGKLDVNALEVAVVERPMWDVDLPDRYVRVYE